MSYPLSIRSAQYTTAGRDQKSRAKSQQPTPPSPQDHGAPPSPGSGWDGSAGRKFALLKSTKDRSMFVINYQLRNTTHPSRSNCGKCIEAQIKPSARMQSVGQKLLPFSTFLPKFHRSFSPCETRQTGAQQWLASELLRERWENKFSSSSLRCYLSESPSICAFRFARAFCAFFLRIYFFRICGSVWFWFWWCFFPLQLNK